MTRTEHDLRTALDDLARRADAHGAPSVADILAGTTTDAPGRHRDAHRLPRWTAPLAAAVLVAAAAGTVAVLARGDDRAADHSDRSAAAPPAPPAPPTTSAVRTVTPVAGPGVVLDDAAKALDTQKWTQPDPDSFFYVHSTDVSTWTSVSGEQAGKGRRNDDGTPIDVPGCRDGAFVSDGQSGSCTLNDVPHYRADAPTQPAAWDAYLEQVAPGAKAAGAQGKIIVQVLHQDLLAPKAKAALLRYTRECAGLRTIAVRPVAGQRLTGVTCASMTAGSYGLAFDARSHALAGFVVVNPTGRQEGPAEIIRRTGIVRSLP